LPFDTAKEKQNYHDSFALNTAANYFLRGFLAF